MMNVLSPETLRMLRAAPGADDLTAAHAAVERDVARAEHARRLAEFQALMRRGRGPAPRDGSPEPTET